MNFSELPNPAAAAKAIKAFQKRFTAKVCLAPNKCDCSPTIISAHTLSVGAMLKPLSRDGHVYSFHINHFTPTEDGPVEFKLKGLRETSVFNGFCGHHDKSLFSPIEDASFICAPHQIYLHAFRAVAKESYLKRRQADSIPTKEMIREIHNIPADLPFELPPEIEEHRALSHRGADEIERLKKRYDEYYLSSDWTRISTTVIPFGKRPNITCNFIYAPDFDFDGVYLQDFENLSKDLDHLAVTVLPTDSGGFALLSFVDTVGVAPRRLISSLLAQKDVTTSLIWLIFSQAENFAMSPDWFDGLGAERQKEIKDQFLSNVDRSKLQHNVLRHCPAFIDAWEPARPFQI